MKKRLTAFTAFLLVSFSIVKGQDVLSSIDSLMMDSKYDQAISILEKKLEGATKANDRIILENKKAAALVSLGKYEDAEELINGIFSEIKDQGLPDFYFALTETNDGFLNLNKGRNDLAEKQKKAEAELNSKGTQYERGVKDYQDKVSKGLVTRATAAEMENSLSQQQQELISLRDKLQSDLMEEEQVMNRQILDYITKYLEEHKSEYKFQYILAKSFGSVVLYSEPGNDITNRVLAGLNQKYASEK